MISVVKEICIFMIIAQAILFFVPGSSYGKYVRLLVGIMMILRIIQPLFQLLTNEEERMEIAERVAGLEAELEAGSAALMIKDNDAIIEESIETELKKKLDECGSGYGIVGAAPDQEGERVVITVSEQEQTDKDGGNIRIPPVKLEDNTERGSTLPDDGAEKERLRKLYGAALGVETERIEIIVE